MTLSSVFVKGQQPYVLHLNTSNGLPNGTVFSIHQDHKGYMWLTTAEGLYRYDGVSYGVYKPEGDLSPVGTDIKEDRYGRVWCQNFDGFLFFVSENKLHPLNQNPPAGFVSYGLTDNHLFVIQKMGVDVYDLKTLQRLRTINIAIEYPEHATSLKQDFYFISDDVLYKIDSEFRLTSTPFFKGKNLHIKSVHTYKDGLYIFSKRNESKLLYFFDANLRFVTSSPIPQLSHIQGSDVIDDTIWFHTPEGAYSLDQGQSLTKKFFFPENSSSKVIRDHQNNYWFSSINNGIYLVADLSDQVYDIHSNALKTFLRSSQGFFIGTQKGELLETDVHFQDKKVIHRNLQKLPVYYIYEDDHNRMISDDGFTIFSKNSKIHFDLALKEAVRLDDKYYAIAISGFNGLLRNPMADKNARSIWDDLFYKHQDRELDGVARLKTKVRAKSIGYLSNEHTLVFATNLGTFMSTPQGEEEIKLNDKSFYSNKLVVWQDSMYMLDAKGNLWQLSSSSTPKLLSKSLDISEGAIQQLKFSEQGLLILTKDFLFVYQDYQVKKYSLPIRYGQIRDFSVKDDVLNILTDRQVLVMKLQERKYSKDVPFFINDFTVNNVSTNWEDFSQFDYNQNNISVSFSVLEFIDKNIPVYYRVNNQDWVLISKVTRTLHFPALSSGDYVLEFRVHDTISPQKIRFEITLPFWKEWWFYLFCFTLGSTAIYFYFRWRSNLVKGQIRLLNEKKELEKNLGKSVLSSIKSQMNPHFFYNALNTIQAYIFTNDKEKANNYLSKFSKLTRLILEMSEKETITLREEIGAIGLYLELEKMRFSEQFVYTFDIAETIDLDLVEFPPMLLQPYVENAIKHGLLHRAGMKHLTLSFEQKGDLLYVIIDDNGIGRKRSAELNQIKRSKHASFSTKANEKRLQILNGGRVNKITALITDKIDAQDNPCGTTVLLVVPI